MQLSELSNKMILESREKNHLKKFFSLDSKDSFRIDIEAYEVSSVQMDSLSDNHTSPLSSFRIEVADAGPRMIFNSDDVVSLRTASTGLSPLTTTRYTEREIMDSRFENLEREVRELSELVNELRERFGI